MNWEMTLASSREGLTDVRLGLGFCQHLETMYSYRYSCQSYTPCARIENFHKQQTVKDDFKKARRSEQQRQT